ncbi:hypothetical protein EYF80_045878 [Liparis tanakae]|uniref:Uncharacterized protein n=1 Tax=Liparis tanakae TaxID=230148 RepID=A0A4Z2FRP4_9TELE|nr:hypothetical protein EYF80_045878 [Liparis tanakae]
MDSLNKNDLPCVARLGLGKPAVDGSIQIPSEPQEGSEVRALGTAAHHRVFRRAETRQRRSTPLRNLAYFLGASPSSPPPQTFTSCRLC